MKIKEKVELVSSLIRTRDYAFEDKNDKVLFNLLLDHYLLYADQSHLTHPEDIKSNKKELKAMYTIMCCLLVQEDIRRLKLLHKLVKKNGYKGVDMFVEVYRVQV